MIMDTSTQVGRSKLNHYEINLDIFCRQSENYGGTNG
ncbi:MAG: hypothetical protein JWP09_223 [Candidatus Taylorbacteria bacterium]|nr:hypothetical protein [Candidatus Taylorbacteria bacterium]